MSIVEELQPKQRLPKLYKARHWNVLDTLLEHKIWPHTKSMAAQMAKDLVEDDAGLMTISMAEYTNSRMC